MSPTPPETGESSDGKNNFNPMNNAVNGIAMNPGKLLTNGHAGEIKSPYFDPAPVPVVEKRGRGRPPKSGTKAQTPNGAVKKRGRPPKVKTEDVPSKQCKITDTMKKTKRTVNRFKDVTKEELMERFLPDRIKPNLDILIIGINPGLFAAYKGHHYAGPGNHFWSCINMSGFVDCKMTSDNDEDLLNYGIGFSTIVERTTPGAKDLSSKEIREGAKKLVEKIQLYKPKIAVFNGKGIYEIFSKEIFGQKKKDFVFGTQINRIPETETYIYVMPSSSARCAQFPRAQDKVHFYVKLKQLRDDIKGFKPDGTVCEVGYTFDLQKATELAKVQHIKQERIDPEYETHGAGMTNGEHAPFLGFNSVPPSGEVQGTSHNATDTNNNNNGHVESNQAEPEKPCASTMVNNAERTLTKMTPRKMDKGENNVTVRHAHLVRYLRQDVDSQPDPDPGRGRKNASGVVIPTTLSPRNPKLQEDVSEEQRQERVGNWVREQQSLEYDSDPPMGMERDESLPGQDAGGQHGVEIDGASQLSAMSAGISGSASESTSGYGSIDASSRRVRLDRVEMWVMEQQHVRRHNQPQIQHSTQQTVTSTVQSLLTSMSQPHTTYQLNPMVSWQPVVSYTPVGYTVTGQLALQSPGNSLHTNIPRGMHKPTTSSHVVASEQTPGTSGLNQTLSAGRSSPYGFLRTPRRDGGSGSSFGTPIRPPVPLYSTWGGEESSGGSGISAPVMLPSNPMTQSSPTQCIPNHLPS